MSGNFWRFAWWNLAPMSPSWTRASLRCGANIHNVALIASKVRIARHDIADADCIRPLLKNLDVIFNLAGEISHTHSMDYPERDLDINTRSQMLFLTGVRQDGAGHPHRLHQHAPGLRQTRVSAGG